MFHFTAVIALFCFVTALWWFLVGWWISSIERAKQQHNREAEWNHHLNTLRRDRDSFRDQVELAHGKIRVLENRRADGTSPPRPTENQAASKAMMARMQGHLDQAKQQINGFAQKVQELKEQSVEREDVLEQLKKKLTETSRTLHDREQKLSLFNTRGQPEAQTNDNDAAHYEKAIQKLRIDMQTQADANEQDRQRLDHTIGEHVQTIGALRKELSQHTKQTSNPDKTRQKLDSLRAQFDDLKNENLAQAEQIEQLSQGSKVVEHQRARLKALQNDFDAQQETLTELETAAANNEPKTQVVRDLKEQLDSQLDANRKLTQSHASLEEQLDDARHKLASLRSATDVNPAPDTRQDEAIQQHLHTIAMLEQKTRDQKIEYDDELRQMREAMQTQEHIVAQLRDVLSKPTVPAKPEATPPANIPKTRTTRPQSGDLFATIEPPVRSVPRAPTVTLYEQAPDSSDNLKKINGIGPVFERALNKLGLYTFAQIAALNEGDIEWVAQELRSFPDRILNGHWVEQAQNLLSNRE